MYFLRNKSKWSKYPIHKSDPVSHVNIDNAEIFDTQVGWCFGVNGPLGQHFSLYRGWSGGAMVLGKRPCRGVLQFG